LQNRQQNIFQIDVAFFMMRIADLLQHLFGYVAATCVHVTHNESNSEGKSLACSRRRRCQIPAVPLTNFPVPLLVSFAASNMTHVFRHVARSMKPTIAAITARAQPAVGVVPTRWETTASGAKHAAASPSAAAATPAASAGWYSRLAYAQSLGSNGASCNFAETMCRDEYSQAEWGECFSGRVAG